MPGDGPVTLVEQFRHQATHRDDLYGALLGVFADDLDAGGAVARVCAGYQDADPADVVHLRLLAGLFRIVLRGDAPGLERFYPSLGGTADPPGAGRRALEVVAAHVDELRAGLALPPQTNEVGRSACLAVALFEVVRRTGRRRVRLLEPGASGGLNLLVDRYRFTGPGWSHGPDDAPLVLDTGLAARPEPWRVVERRGCDLAPVDASSAEGGRYLTSFVWPFDLHRHARLAGALEAARAHPVRVDRAPAASWLREQLSQPVDDDVVAVVWTSITEQYWPAHEVAAVAEAVAQARTGASVVHVSMEGLPPETGPFVVERHGPLTRIDGEPLFRSGFHGPPLYPLAANRSEPDVENPPAAPSLE